MSQSERAFPELGTSTTPAAAEIPGWTGRSAHDDALARRLATCRHLIRQGRTIDRRMADRFHVNADFAMLLDLYISAHEGRETYLCEVRSAATATASTAHRKLGEMARLGLVIRTRTKVDRRRVCVRLSPAMIAQVDSLLDRLSEAPTD